MEKPKRSGWDRLRSQRASLSGLAEQGAVVAKDHDLSATSSSKWVAAVDEYSQWRSNEAQEVLAEIGQLLAAPTTSEASSQWLEQVQQASVVGREQLEVTVNSGASRQRARDPWRQLDAVAALRAANIVDDVFSNNSGGGGGDSGSKELDGSLPSAVAERWEDSYRHEEPVWLVGASGGAGLSAHLPRERAHVHLWQHRGEAKRFVRSLRLAADARHFLALPTALTTLHSVMVAHGGCVVTVTWLPLVDGNAGSGWVAAVRSHARSGASLPFRLWQRCACAESTDRNKGGALDPLLVCGADGRLYWAPLLEPAAAGPQWAPPELAVVQTAVSDALVAFDGTNGVRQRISPRPAVPERDDEAILMEGVVARLLRSALLRQGSAGSYVAWMDATLSEYAVASVFHEGGVALHHLRHVLDSLRAAVAAVASAADTTAVGLAGASARSRALLGGDEGAATSRAAVPLEELLVARGGAVAMVLGCEIVCRTLKQIVSHRAAHILCDAYRTMALHASGSAPEATATEETAARGPPRKASLGQVALTAVKVLAPSAKRNAGAGGAQPLGPPSVAGPSQFLHPLLLRQLLDATNDVVSQFNTGSHAFLEGTFLPTLKFKFFHSIADEAERHRRALALMKEILGGASESVRSWPRPDSVLPIRFLYRHIAARLGLHVNDLLRRFDRPAAFAVLRSSSRVTADEPRVASLLKWIRELLRRHVHALAQREKLAVVALDEALAAAAAAATAAPAQQQQQQHAVRALAFARVFGHLLLWMGAGPGTAVASELAAHLPSLRRAVGHSEDPPAVPALSESEYYALARWCLALGSARCGGGDPVDDAVERERRWRKQGQFLLLEQPSRRALEAREDRHRSALKAQMDREGEEIAARQPQLVEFNATQPASYSTQDGRDVVVTSRPQRSVYATIMSRMAESVVRTLRDSKEAVAQKPKLQVTRKRSDGPPRSGNNASGSSPQGSSPLAKKRVSAEELRLRRRLSHYTDAATAKVSVPLVWAIVDPSDSMWMPPLQSPSSSPPLSPRGGGGAAEETRSERAAAAAATGAGSGCESPNAHSATGGDEEEIDDNSFFDPSSQNLIRIVYDDVVATESVGRPDEPEPVEDDGADSVQEPQNVSDFAGDGVACSTPPPGVPVEGASAAALSENDDSGEPAPPLAPVTEEAQDDGERETTPVQVEVAAEAEQCLDDSVALQSVAIDSATEVVDTAPTPKEIIPESGDVHTTGVDSAVVADEVAVADGEEEDEEESEEDEDDEEVSESSDAVDEGQEPHARKETSGDSATKKKKATKTTRADGTQTVERRVTHRKKRAASDAATAPSAQPPSSDESPPADAAETLLKGRKPSSRLRKAPSSSSLAAASSSATRVSIVALGGVELGDDSESESLSSMTPRNSDAEEGDANSSPAAKSASGKWRAAAAEALRSDDGGGGGDGISTATALDALFAKARAPRNNAKPGKRGGPSQQQQSLESPRQQRESLEAAFFDIECRERTSIMDSCLRYFDAELPREALVSSLKANRKEALRLQHEDLSRAMEAVGAVKQLEWTLVKLVVVPESAARHELSDRVIDTVELPLLRSFASSLTVRLGILQEEITARDELLADAEASLRRIVYELATVKKRREKYYEQRMRDLDERMRLDAEGEKVERALEDCRARVRAFVGTHGGLATLAGERSGSGGETSLGVTAALQEQETWLMQELEKKQEKVLLARIERRKRVEHVHEWQVQRRQQALLARDTDTSLQAQHHLRAEHPDSSSFSPVLFSRVFSGLGDVDSTRNSMADDDNESARLGNVRGPQTDKKPTRLRTGDVQPRVSRSLSPHPVSEASPAVSRKARANRSQLQTILSTDEIEHKLREAEAEFQAHARLHLRAAQEQREAEIAKRAAALKNFGATQQQSPPTGSAIERRNVPDQW